ncbi:MAG: PD40 domain-containing protein [Candidatus Marinimicrobia bacterium]|nr:PD40 domain-containing protein [Candidatus Neomarinimicrobiota bacterium]
MSFLKYNCISIFLCGLTVSVFGQDGFATYNHPELEWKTFETEHFEIHYHQGAEWTALKTAEIAESVYDPITSFYNYKPDQKTDLIIKDIGDISNGAAYYYDNKIEIWATPLDYPLRGNHHWLLDVISHEFAHIVSLAKSMKYSRSVPGFYFQVIDYEDEKRDDVIYGYPRVISSYPIPGLVIPMWLAEGMAQYMWPGTSNDFWDSHRDMLMRDRVLQHNVLSLTEMASFGKRGIGNESTYNQGYAFVEYLAERFGPEVISNLAAEISRPVQFSIDNALKKVTGIRGDQLHKDWVNQMETRYQSLTGSIQQNPVKGDIIIEEASTQYYPEWSGDSILYYLSNKGHDYFMQTSLFRMNLNTGKKTLIQPAVLSRISVSQDGQQVYYSKNSKPDKHGSVYYDLYRYDLKKKKEKQITKYSRAYNPSISPDGKRLAYISGKDGTSNLHIMNLDSSDSIQLTDYNNGEELFSANWSPDGQMLAFDYLTDHGRNLAIIYLADERIEYVDNSVYDTRNPYFSPDGKWLYFASDQTGIFNIYRKSLSTNSIELITNVTGGAFMPAVNSKGELLYSLFENSRFKIAKIEAPNAIDPTLSHYCDYSAKIPGMMDFGQDSLPTSFAYKQQFSKMFYLPRVMIDYGTVKPGFYFYSSEILEKFNIFGGASLNRIMDRDIFILLEYHQWYPTLFVEFYNITRNLFDQKAEISARPAIFDYKFDLLEFVTGISAPLSGFNKVRLDVSFSKYRAVSDTKIPFEALYSNGFTYDYYKGMNFKLNWQFRKIRRTVNSDTNPDNGLTLNTNIYRNYDKFIRDFDVNNAYGTLGVDFRNNFYWKIEHEGNWYHKYPVFNKLVGTLNWQIGTISKPDINSFFNFFAGGMPGLKGYPFYSIEGRNLLIMDYTWRIPLFTEKDIQILPFNLQNAFVATYVEAGNAWSNVNGYPRLDWPDFSLNGRDVIKAVTADFKRDVGLQLRLSGFSFYAYPTSISLDFVYGLDEFTIEDSQGNLFTYGHEWRSYLTILFGL